MGFDDKYKISVHAVITDHKDNVLQIKQTYTDKRWGLPGGSLDLGETVHEALTRECLEELNCKIKILYLSGIYYHSEFNSHVCIFRCELTKNSKIKLSSEHSEYKYFPLKDLSVIQQKRVRDCLAFKGETKSAAF